MGTTYHSTYIENSSDTDKYSFEFYAKDANGEEVRLSLENEECFFDMTQLDLYIDSFERFLKACGFIFGNKHLELVDVDDDADDDVGIDDCV